MKVLCFWEGYGDNSGAYVVESDSSHNLPRDFENRIAHECEKYDAWMARVYKKKERLRIVAENDPIFEFFAPNWDRPSGAKMIWYLPESGDAVY